MKVGINYSINHISQQRHLINSLMVFQSFWPNRDLIWQMTKRDVIGRYRGSTLGLLWSFFNPILMLAIYTFIFSVVFQIRWGQMTGSKTEFAIFLFAGLIVYNLFSECIDRAPGLILENVNYVKKVLFPLEILPWVTICSALFHTAINILVLLVFYLIINASLNWTLIFLPLILLPLVFVSVGLVWFLSSLSVYIRDFKEVIKIVTRILLFMSPIFYPLSAVPESFRSFLYLNYEKQI